MGASFSRQNRLQKQPKSVQQPTPRAQPARFEIILKNRIKNARITSIHLLVDIGPTNTNHHLVVFYIPNENSPKTEQKRAGFHLLNQDDVDYVYVMFGRKINVC